MSDRVHVIIRATLLLNVDAADVDVTELRDALEEAAARGLARSDASVDEVLSCSVLEVIDAVDISWGDRSAVGDPACRVCGCTENAACAGGCQWVPDPAGEGELCSACLPGVLKAMGAG